MRDLLECVILPNHPDDKVGQLGNWHMLTIDFKGKYFKPFNNRYAVESVFITTTGTLIYNDKNRKRITVSRRKFNKICNPEIKIPVILYNNRLFICYIAVIVKLFLLLSFYYDYCCCFCFCCGCCLQHGSRATAASSARCSQGALLLSRSFSAGHGHDTTFEPPFHRLPLPSKPVRALPAHAPAPAPRPLPVGPLTLALHRSCTRSTSSCGAMASRPKRASTSTRRI